MGLASPSGGYPGIKFAGAHFYSTPGGERHCESKVSNYPRTQHNVPGLRASAQTARSGV